MKKIIAFILLVILCLSSTACGLNAQQKSMKEAFEKQMAQQKQEDDEKIAEAEKVYAAIKNAVSLEEKKALAVNAGIFTEEEISGLSHIAVENGAKKFVDWCKESKELHIKSTKEAMEKALKELE